MEIGVLNGLTNGGRCFEHVSQFGLHVCQLVSWDSSQATKAIAETVVKEAARAKVRICAMWSGVPGPAEWNFTRGPVTLGLVPPEYRAERVAVLKSGRTSPSGSARRPSSPTVVSSPRT